jgi:CHAP domain-containing protein
MADGTAPSGVDLDVLPPLDDGTSARIGSPTPGVIGLDAKGSGASKQQRHASIPEQVVSFARHQRGSRVGDGQCFALADRALRNAGGRSAADYGAVTPDADYQWGTSITLAELQPGDVIQFRGYSYERVDVTDTERETRTERRTESRPHHTAIVESVGSNGEVTVLEQNAPDGSAVHSTHLFFTAGTTTSGNTTTTITVQGTVWFYRAQAR